MRRFIHWFKYTAGIVGIPVLAVLLLVWTQKAIFTGTCVAAGWKCQYAFAVLEALATIEDGEEYIIPAKKGR